MLNNKVPLAADSAGFFYTKAQQLKNLGDIESAAANYEIAIKLGVNNFEIYEDLAYCYYLLSSLSRSVLDQSPSLVSISKRLAIYEKMIEYQNNASQNYLASIKLNPNLPYLKEAYQMSQGLLKSILQEAAKSCAENYLYQSAISYLDRFITYSPNLTFGYYQRGKLYFKQGNFAQAIVDFTQGVAISNDIGDDFLQIKLSRLSRLHYMLGYAKAYAKQDPWPDYQKSVEFDQTENKQISQGRNFYHTREFPRPAPKHGNLFDKILISMLNFSVDIVGSTNIDNNPKDVFQLTSKTLCSMGIFANSTMITGTNSTGYIADIPYSIGKP